MAVFLYLIEKDVKKSVLTKLIFDSEMEAVRSSETFVSLHRTTRPHVSEYSKIQEARCRPARTAFTAKAGCPRALPTFRDIPFSGIRYPSLCATS